VRFVFSIDKTLVFVPDDAVALCGNTANPLRLFGSASITPSGSSSASAATLLGFGKRSLGDEGAVQEVGRTAYRQRLSDVIRVPVCGFDAAEATTKRGRAHIDPERCGELRARARPRPQSVMVRESFRSRDLAADACGKLTARQPRVGD
jgi:hypothetical protein